MALDIVFYGGKQAGAICLLSLLARGESVKLAIAQDDIVEQVAGAFRIPCAPPKILDLHKNDGKLAQGQVDLFVCAHGKKIVGAKILAAHRLGGINVHPCLWKYKGADPVSRLLADKGAKASVGVHRMTSKVDSGEVLSEIFTDVSGCGTVLEIYNALYPLYAIALNSALDSL